jgi:NAD(P)H dehydrogenase (quinone)
MGFNPVMGAHELEPLSIGHAADADVAQAQQEVRSADAVTVIYPLWWATMPAMMNGYPAGWAHLPFLGFRTARTSAFR